MMVIGERGGRRELDRRICEVESLDAEGLGIKLCVDEIMKVSYKNGWWEALRWNHELPGYHGGVCLLFYENKQL